MKIRRTRHSVNIGFYKLTSIEKKIPSRATISLSLNPILLKISRICVIVLIGCPLSAPGSRPSGTLVGLGESVRPPRQLIFGPPISSMATQPAKVQMSAYESPELVLMGSRKSLAIFKPALAIKTTPKKDRLGLVIK